jgi:hypothetical protein
VIGGLGWEELVKPIEAGDPDGVVAVLAGAAEADRRALAGPLAERRRLLWQPGERDWWERLFRESAALLVAGAGCAPGVAKVVSWLTPGRRSVRPGPVRGAERIPGQVVAVLQDRGQPAIDKVAAGLAARLRANATTNDWELTFDWRLVAALVDAGGAPVPTDDGFVLGWLAALPGATDGRSRSMVELLRDDPYLDVLGPRIMEVDGAAQRLGPGWRHALVALAEEGRLARDGLLGGCLYRLRAGGRAGALRQVLELHQELAPTLDELAEHRAQYVDLMGSPRGFVAALAQESLRALHDAGRLPLADLLAASGAALLRGEKALVRTQLSWLDQVAAGTGPPDEVLATVAVGLGQERLDLAERALKVLARHLPAAGDAARRAVRDAADPLTGDLRRQAAALPGIALTAPPAPTPPTPAGLGHHLPGPAGSGGPGWEEMPAGIGSVGELAAEVAALFRNPPDAVRLERVLDGLVRWTAADRGLVAEAVVPQVPSWFGGQTGALVDLLHAAAGLPERTVPRHLRHAALSDVASPFDRTLMGRLGELVGQLRSGPPPELLATPAWTTGHVDPERLLGTLVRAERDGWEPGTFDVGQALLRLPREVDPAIRDRAAALDLRAAHQLVRWLDLGGLPDPEPVVVRAGTDPQRWVGRSPAYRLVTAYREAGGPDGAPDGRAGQLGLPSWLVRLPESEAAPRAFGYHWAPGLDLWPAVLPSHREIVAAYVLPTVAPAADADRNGGTEVLPALARCHGPLGPGVALAIGYGLAARREADRLPAVDALLALPTKTGRPGGVALPAAAGRPGGRPGEPVGVLVGRLIGPVVADRVVALSRLTAGLAELDRSGAHHTVRDITAGVLAAVLPAGTRPPGTSDLLALASGATAAAGDAGALGALPGLAAQADHGTGRLRTEARRLQRTLATLP